MSPLEAVTLTHIRHLQEDTNAIVCYPLLMGINVLLTLKNVTVQMMLDVLVAVRKNVAVLLGVWEIAMDTIGK